MGVGGTTPETHDLPALERTLWQSETRHDRALMEATFAPDVQEFGRSGRRYTRDDLLPTGETDTIDATLHALTITEISPEIALVTCISELRRPTGTEWANRSSLWDRASGRWQLRFHQGTPCEAPT
jgi:ribonuclease HI